MDNELTEVLLTSVSGTGNRIYVSTAPASRSLADLKHNAQAGCISYSVQTDASCSDNRLLFWRLYDETLELFEESLTCDVADSRVQFVFREPILHVSAFDNAPQRELLIAVTTCGMVHLLAFAYPNNKPNAPKKLKVASPESSKHKSILAEASSANVAKSVALQNGDATQICAATCHFRVAQTTPNASQRTSRGATPSGAARRRLTTATVKFELVALESAFSFTNGSISVLHCELSGSASAKVGRMNQYELKHLSTLQRLTGWLPGFKSGEQGAADASCDMLFVDDALGENQPALACICRDAKLRLWNVESRSCAQTIELGQLLDQSSSFAVSHFRLRLSSLRNTKTQFLVVHVADDHQSSFAFVAKEQQTSIHRMIRTCSVPNGDGGGGGGRRRQLVDFCLTDTTKSSEGELLTVWMEERGDASLFHRTVSVLFEETSTSRLSLNESSQSSDASETEPAQVASWQRAALFCCSDEPASCEPDAEISAKQILLDKLFGNDQLDDDARNRADERLVTLRSSRRFLTEAIISALRIGYQDLVRLRSDPGKSLAKSEQLDELFAALAVAPIGSFTELGELCELVASLIDELVRAELRAMAPGGSLARVIAVIDDDYQFLERKWCAQFMANVAQCELSCARPLAIVFETHSSLRFLVRARTLGLLVEPTLSQQLSALGLRSLTAPIDELGDEENDAVFASCTVQPSLIRSLTSQPQGEAAFDALLRMTTFANRFFDSQETDTNHLQDLLNAASSRLFDDNAKATERESESESNKMDDGEVDHNNDADVEAEYPTAATRLGGVSQLIDTLRFSGLVEPQIEESGATWDPESQPDNNETTYRKKVVHLDRSTARRVAELFSQLGLANVLDSVAALLDVLADGHQRVRDVAVRFGFDSDAQHTDAFDLVCSSLFSGSGSESHLDADCDTVVARRARRTPLQSAFALRFVAAACERELRTRKLVLSRVLALETLALAHVAYAPAAAHTLVHAADLVDALGAQLIRLLAALCRNEAALRLFTAHARPSSNAVRVRMLLAEFISSFDSARHFEAAFGDCFGTPNTEPHESDHDHDASHKQRSTLTLLGDCLVTPLSGALWEQTSQNAANMGALFSATCTHVLRNLGATRHLYTFDCLLLAARLDELRVLVRWFSRAFSLLERVDEAERDEQADPLAAAHRCTLSAFDTTLRFFHRVTDGCAFEQAIAAPCEFIELFTSLEALLAPPSRIASSCLSRSLFVADLLALHAEAANDEHFSASSFRLRFLVPRCLHLVELLETLECESERERSVLDAACIQMCTLALERVSAAQLVGADSDNENDNDSDSDSQVLRRVFLTKLFRHALSAAQYDAAFACWKRLASAFVDQRSDTLRTLVVTLCDRAAFEQLAGLVTAESFDCFDEVCTIVRARARAVPPPSLFSSLNEDSTHYRPSLFELAYGLYTLRGMHYEAASCAYELNMRLDIVVRRLLQQNTVVPAQRTSVAVCLRKQAECVAATLNSLRLCVLADTAEAEAEAHRDTVEPNPDADARLLRESATVARCAMRTGLVDCVALFTTLNLPRAPPRALQALFLKYAANLFANQRPIVSTYDEVLQAFALLEARCTLLDSTARDTVSLTFLLGPPRELVAALARDAHLDVAVRTVRACKLHYDAVFESLAQFCVEAARRNRHVEAAFGDRLRLAAASCGLLQAASVEDLAWTLLDAYLTAFERDASTRYHRVVLTRLFELGYDSAPRRLLDSYKRLNVSELLFVCLRFEKLEQAAAVACSLLEALLTGAGADRFAIDYAALIARPGALARVVLPVSAIEFLRECFAGLGLLSSRTDEAAKRHAELRETASKLNRLYDQYKTQLAQSARLASAARPATIKTSISPS